MLLATCAQPPPLLQRILADGELRVVTRNSPDAYYLGSHGPEGPVGGGVGVPAGDGHPGLGEAELGPDDVDDALVAAPQVKEGDAVLPCVRPEGLQHALGQRVLEGLGAVVGGDDVVHGGEGAVGVAYPKAKVLEHPEGLGARDLVEEVEVYEELALAVFELPHLVGFPNLLVERLSHETPLTQNPRVLWGPGDTRRPSLDRARPV